MEEESVAIVIPAKNEEETIGKVLDQMRDEVSDYFSRIEFVVSSSSRDSTETIAEEKDAIVVRDGGTGLGEAMFRGLKKALELNPDYIMTIDSDLQFNPGEASKLIERKDKADLVLGSRFREDGVRYEMSRIHRLGNYILTGIVNLNSDIEITDAQTGYRLMNREVAEELRMVGRHTYVQETILDAHFNGYEIVEVPVSFRQRNHGGSKVVSSILEYSLRTFPVLIHRKGFSTYIANGFSLISFSIGFISLIYFLAIYNIISVLISLMIIQLSILMFYVGMTIDSEYP